MYEDINICEDIKICQEKEAAISSQFPQTISSNVRPIRHHYDDIPYQSRSHEPVWLHGYDEAVNDGGGYELPLQDMTCITNKENKPPTPENATETPGYYFYITKLYF